MEDINTQLVNACRKSDPSVLQTLLFSYPTADVNEPCPETGKFPLFVAIEHGRLHSVQLLVQQGRADVNLTPKLWSPLMAAIWYHQYEIAMYLVQCGADVNVVYNGRAPLTHIIVWDQRAPVSFMRFLLENGADVNATSAGGGTPLIWAVKCRVGVDSHFEDIVCLLLQYGASLAVKAGGHQRNILNFALLRPDHETAVDFLLQFITQIDQLTDNETYTPLMLAIKENCSLHTINALIDHGADVNYKHINGKSPMQIALECNNKAHLEALRQRGGHL